MKNITAEVPSTFIRLVVQCEVTTENLNMMKDLAESMVETAPTYLVGNLVIKLESGTLEFAASQS